MPLTNFLRQRNQNRTRALSCLGFSTSKQTIADDKQVNIFAEKSLVNSSSPIRGQQLKRYCFRYFIVITSLLLSQLASAATYNLPSSQSSIIGKPQQITIKSGDTLTKLSHRYDLSLDEILKANPKQNPDRLRAGQTLILPTQFILPPGPKQGIVINLPEMRLYYYIPNSEQIMTFPIGIGREGWKTPLLNTNIIEKRKDPTWYIPQSIRENTLKKTGKVLPKSIPPGPDNPLGQYALRLTPRSYLIHGTNAPHTIGKRTSSGCIRLYPEDIAQLYQKTSVGTPVRIINYPFKVGWQENILYFQTIVPLKDYQKSSVEFKAVINEFKRAEKSHHLQLDWDTIYAMARVQDGLPRPVAAL